MTNDITHKLAKIVLADEAATLAYAGQFARCIRAGLIVYLHGNLGAGKTTFVRGVLQSLGYIGKVKSPTYTLVETYELVADMIDSNGINHNNNSKYNIYHFDLYRFIDEDEWDAAGFREYFNPQSICMIEWPEKAENLLPQADVDIHLLIVNEARSIQFSANTLLGRQCLENL